MKSISKVKGKDRVTRSEKVLQFGEGNFLRAFTDWMVDLANKGGVFDGSIVLCQPIAAGMAEAINKQRGLYTLVMRGMENGRAEERVETIEAVSRCINPYADYDALLTMARNPELQVIVSNTTEAGIAYHAGDALTDRPPHSFPAKLTAFLHERFIAFHGTAESGLLVLPVELIDDNGAVLRGIVRRYAEEWNLGAAFLAWFDEHVHIASTLVDRIVTGHPRDEMRDFEERLGYADDLLVTSELFNLWVIEGDRRWADVFPIHKTDANVVWTDDAKPYKARKVRILNGAHTSTALAAWLAGHETVLDFMNDALFRRYLDRMIFSEIIPSLDMPKSELESFANAVLERFENPYIRHRVLDISLNSCAKFAARCLPSILAYQDRCGKLPELLVFSFAAFMRFYRGRMVDGVYTGARCTGETYAIKDDAGVLDFFERAWARGDGWANAQDVAAAVLSRKEFWNGEDLTQVPGLCDAVAGYLRAMEEPGGVKAVMAALPGCGE